MEAPWSFCTKELEENPLILPKDFIRDHRPALDLEKVATGEHWFGTQAHELGPVNRLALDDLVVAACKDKTVLRFTTYKRKTIR